VDVRKPFLGDGDALLTLYYGGGTAGLFEAVDEVDVLGDIEVELCEAALKAAPDFVEAISFLGNTFTRRGLYGKGLELDLRLVKLRPESPRANYNLACSYALLGEPEKAFRALEVAVEYGFDDPEHLARDDDLKSLREDARFAELIVRVRERRRGAK
jgi:tetratricopeptide (TPR) repeat protein